MEERKEGERGTPNNTSSTSQLLLKVPGLWEQGHFRPQRLSLAEGNTLDMGTEKVGACPPMSLGLLPGPFAPPGKGFMEEMTKRWKSERTPGSSFSGQ